MLIERQYRVLLETPEKVSIERRRTVNLELLIDHRDDGTMNKTWNELKAKQRP